MAILFSDNLNAEQRTQIQQLFQQFQHPSLQKDLISLNALKKIEKGGDTLRVELTMPFAWNTAFEQLKNTLSAPLQTVTA